MSESPITRSATQHGVTEADIRHALRNWLAVEEQDENRSLFLGPDTSGVLIEVGIVEDDDSVRIIHAMRPGRLHRFEER